MNKPPKKTLSESVMLSNAALIARGGRRMPGGHLQPEVNQALKDLIESGYAATPLAVINAALLDAHKKIGRSAK